MKSESVWKSQPLPGFSKVAHDAEYDVVIIGGGIAGLATAYLLKQTGKTVCVLERDRLGGGDTGYTTAHLTQVTDDRLSDLVKVFGKQGAGLVWGAGAAAIDTIEAIAKAEHIECEFQRVPGFFHASIHGTKDESQELRADCDLATELGFDATFIESVPVYGKPGVRFPNQARFHPLKYLAGLAGAVSGSGCAIHEESEVKEVAGDPLSVTVNDHRIKCGYLVIATHVPLMGQSNIASATLFQTKLFPYSSYVLGAKVAEGVLPQALFWDTTDPYYYLRIERHGGHDYVIFGGEDHKTGQVEDTEERFSRLERTLHEIIPTAKVDHRWSGQVIETNDGLPYIGETAERQFVGTGFAGNGMTFGTLTALMACDKILGRKNPCADLFDVGRKKIVGGTWELLKESVDYPWYFLRDRLMGTEGDSFDDVPKGQGKVLKLSGKRVACARDDDGTLHAVSAVCTHMGCIVHWNVAEKTWDCPCHGSRFRRTGEVMGGPAESPLEAFEIAPHETAANKA